MKESQVKIMYCENINFALIVFKIYGTSRMLLLCHCDIKRIENCIITIHLNVIITSGIACHQWFVVISCPFNSSIHVLHYVNIKTNVDNQLNSDLITINTICCLKLVNATDKLPKKLYIHFYWIHHKPFSNKPTPSQILKNYYIKNLKNLSKKSNELYILMCIELF